MMSNVLRFENVSYWYEEGRNILSQIDMEFEAGRFYSIIGTSGSGKTTFLSLAAGLDEVKEGNIYYQDILINDIGLEEYRNKYVSIVFQGYNLLTYMTGIQNIVCAMEIKNISVKDKKSVALEALKRVGLSEEQANKKVLHLSGGQQQRIAIARALVTESGLIIADEPTGNLDEETSNEIISLLKQIVREDNRTVIMVTHSKALALEADEVYGVKDAQLIKLV